jgi:hypothetical protein
VPPASRRPERSTAPARILTAPDQLDEAELALRGAGRLLEVQVDDGWQRLARIVFRLAQRIAVDSGRLDRAA